jgi:signal transduction histidine kinase
MPTAIEGSDGRLWFSVSGGVVWLDPKRRSARLPAPPVSIQSVSADSERYELDQPLRFPAGTSNVQIGYAAVSLLRPDSIRFRYRLQGVDDNWRDAGTLTSVSYRSLPPGAYRFEVDASDANGIWSGRTATAQFSVLPAYYQTNWFRVLCAALVLAMFWMAYRLRVRQLQRRFEMTLLAEEKLREKDDALEKARTELARVSRLTTLGELTTSIAHEVSQPLSAMVASAGACARWLAADPPALAEARSTLDNIVADGKRAREVIARIRALTKRQALRMDLLDLNREILEVLALTEQELSSHDIVLETKLHSTLPPVKGDRVQLQQVLLNLILNATEAMSAVNDRPRELTIVSAQDTGGSVVEVRDSGIGLDQEHAERVFDAFYTTKAEGLGIGLSISRSIVEAHGGRLRVAPNQPHGAVFGFSLPAAENGQS